MTSLYYVHVELLQFFALRSPGLYYGVVLNLSLISLLDLISTREMWVVRLTASKKELPPTCDGKESRGHVCKLNYLLYFIFNNRLARPPPRPH